MYILHIGTNKTGTSSIQKYLFTNQERLKDKGIFYPDIGIQGKAHHNLARLLLGAENKFGISDAWIEELSNLEKNYQATILSSELLHTHKTPSDLLSYFPRGNTKVVIYIREHFSYLRSWYQQAVQLRNITSKFMEFIELDFVNPQYIDLIKKWEGVYGPSNVIVRPYDRNSLVNRDVVCDFLSHLDISHDEVEPTSSNLSISGNLLFYKLLVNNLIEERNNYRLASEIAVLSEIDETFSGSITVQEADFRKVLFKYREDKNKLNSEYGITLKPKLDDTKSRLYPDPERLHHDFRKIIESGREKNMQIVDEKYTRLFNINI